MAGRPPAAAAAAPAPRPPASADPQTGARLRVSPPFAKLVACPRSAPKSIPPRKTPHELNVGDFASLSGRFAFPPTAARSAESRPSHRAYAIDDGVRRWRNHTE